MRKYILPVIVIALAMISCNKTEPEKKDDKPKASIIGTVSCDGKPVPGVWVSDGIAPAVKTDENGKYALESRKKNGMVYISMPSGYTVAADKTVPQFFKHTTKGPAAQETIDFELIDAGDQTKHKMLFIGDVHLMNKNNDLNQFKTFKDEINAYVKAHPGEKIYGIQTGDCTWDMFWYSTYFKIPEYLTQAKDINLNVFYSMGNHDGDYKIADDWEYATEFRKYYGPTYYSLNVGNIHYVVLDNVKTHNDPSQGTSGRDYSFGLTDEELAWLKDDLSHIDADTPVVAFGHIPLFGTNGKALMKGSNDMPTSDYVAPFSKFKDVRFISAHTHTMYNNVVAVDGKDIVENNIAALCCDFWISGSYDPRTLICKDGTPGGYRIYDVDGNNVRMTYKAVGRDNYLFRAYDRNSIEITAAKYCKKADASHAREYENYLYSFKKADNQNYIYVYVWDWQEGWTISVTENGKALTGTMGAEYDPLYMITSMVEKCNDASTGSFTLDYKPSQNQHCFKYKASSATSTVTIKVTDNYGNSRTEVMQRPKAFDVNTYGEEGR